MKDQTGLAHSATSVVPTRGDRARPGLVIDSERYFTPRMVRMVHSAIQ